MQKAVLELICFRTLYSTPNENISKISYDENSLIQNCCICNSQITGLFSIPFLFIITFYS